MSIQTPGTTSSALPDLGNNGIKIAETPTATIRASYRQGFPGPTWASVYFPETPMKAPVLLIVDGRAAYVAYDHPWRSWLEEIQRDLLAVDNPSS